MANRTDGARDVTSRVKRKLRQRAWRQMPVVLALTSAMFVTACDERLNVDGGGVDIGGSGDGGTEVRISDSEADALAADAAVSEDTIRVTAESDGGTTAYARSVQSVTVTSGADSSVRDAMVKTACKVVHGEAASTEDFYAKVGELSLSADEMRELGGSVQQLIDEMSAAMESSNDTARAEVVVFCHTAQK